MRVYELAKELGVQSKDLLTKLKDGGFSSTSHMTVISEEAQAYLKKCFATGTKAVKEIKVSEHKPVKPTPQASPSTLQKEKIEPEMPATPQKITEPKIVPAGREVAEDFELAEIREQERIKRLLQTTGLSGFVVGQQQPPRRRRRRRRARIVAQEIVKAPVTAAVLERNLPLFQAADLLGKTPGDLIMALLKKGIACNRNHVLSIDTIRDLGEQFGISIDVKSAQPEADKKTQKASISSQGTTRWPVVVVMGHVDHGKTTLLDHIRKMNVAASEKGGITQHIRAWEVNSTHGKVVFLDTPGHEAFSYLRQRGSKITDIVVLVIAADDGVKPQTVEAIKHAKEADVPIIVAINKIDKASPSAIETVKRQLSQYELLPEEWGGQTIFVPLSAKTGQGVQDLLEMIILQSQLMELKAETNIPARAFVLESHVEKGFGPVATVICKEGVLKQGDYFVCGSSTGKVRTLINSFGKKVTQADPSTPVQVVGFDTFAGVTDWLNVVPQQEYLKARSQGVIESIDTEKRAQPFAAGGLEKPKGSINLIIKMDTRGSKEAVMDSVDKLIKKHKDIKCPINIIMANIGDISESDVELAENTQALLIGLHVKIEKNANILAKDKKVNVQIYQIIYEMIDQLEKLLLSKKEVVMKWNKVGEAEVRKVFDIKGAGVIAGCYLRDGVLSRGNKVVCMRGGKQVGEGKVVTLQRDRKTVKEIHAGYECGFVAEGFSEWKEGDTVLCYAETTAE